jgi:hypothetical protein
MPSHAEDSRARYRHDCPQQEGTAANQFLRLHGDTPCVHACDTSTCIAMRASIRYEQDAAASPQWVTPSRFANLAEHLVVLLAREAIVPGLQDPSGELSPTVVRPNAAVSSGSMTLGAKRTTYSMK